MKKIVVSLVGASALALATAGMAAATNSTAANQNETFFHNGASGIFASGNLGYGSVDFKKNEDFSPAATKLDDNGFAWNLNGGYQLNKYLAAEVGYVNYASVTATAGGLKGKSKMYGIDLLAKGIYPISDEFSVFAKAGAMDLHEKVTVNGISRSAKSHRWVPEFGLGGAYNINPQVALTLQGIATLRTTYHHNGVKVAMPATHAILAGVTYKFHV